MLTNYVLLRSGLPPMVIKGAERDRYIGALQNADVGRMEPLAEFMLENVLWSLGLAIRAAKGESIREAGDVEKKVELFVRRHKAGGPKTSDVELLDHVFHRWIRPTLDRVESALESLGRLFSGTTWESYATVGQRTVARSSGLLKIEHWEETKLGLATPGFRLSNQQLVGLRRDFQWKDYTGRGIQGFSVALSLAWILDGGSVAFLAHIEGRPIPLSIQQVRYSALTSRDTADDPAVDAIVEALMAKIARRSGERN